MDKNDKCISPLINFKLGENHMCTSRNDFDRGICQQVDNIKKEVYFNDCGGRNPCLLNDDCTDDSLNFVDSMITEGPCSLNGYVSQSDEFYSANDFSLTSDSTIENEVFDNHMDSVNQCQIQIVEVNEVTRTEVEERVINERKTRIYDQNHNEIVKKKLIALINDEILGKINAAKQIQAKDEFRTQSTGNNQNIRITKENDELETKTQSSHEENLKFIEEPVVNDKKMENSKDDAVEPQRKSSHLPNIVAMRRKSDSISEICDESNSDLNRLMNDQLMQIFDPKTNNDDKNTILPKDVALDNVSDNNQINFNSEFVESTIFSEKLFINETLLKKNDLDNSLPNKFNPNKTDDVFNLTKDKFKNGVIESSNIKLNDKRPDIVYLHTKNRNSFLRSQLDLHADIDDTRNPFDNEIISPNYDFLFLKNDDLRQTKETNSVTKEMTVNLPDNRNFGEFLDQNNKINNISTNINNNDKNNYDYDINFINGAFNWFKEVRNEQSDRVGESDTNLGGDICTGVEYDSLGDAPRIVVAKEQTTDDIDHVKVKYNIDNDKKKKDNEIATRNILNAFLNQDFGDSYQEMEDYRTNDENLPTVASVTTSVIDAPTLDKTLHTITERKTSKLEPDSIEYDSLNSGSYLSNGSNESIDKSGLERKSTKRSSVNNAKINLPVTNDIQTCGKCCDDIKKNVIYNNNIDSLMKSEDVYKNGNKNEMTCSKNDKSSKDLFYVHNERVGRNSESSPRDSEQLDDKPSLTEISVEKRSSLFRKMSTLPLGLPGGSGEDSNDSCLLDDEPSKFMWKGLLAQILAVSAKNSLALNFGMSVGFQTIAIPSLSKPNDDLHLDQQQISLYGSLFFTVIPVGCLMSGPTIHGWGRKPAMLVFCLPLFVAWWVYYFSQSPMILYLAILLMGFVNGLLEAPILTYVAEITEARWRGMLASSSVVAALFGVFLQLLLGNLFTWRMTAAINSVFPIISFISICFVPESPHWLAGKGRRDDVEKSLMWLRGWVDKSAVSKEVDSLMLAHSQPKVAATPLAWKAYASRTFIEPFLIVVGSFAIGHFSGMATVQTYSVMIFNNLGVQGWSWTAAMGATQVLGATACVIALPLLGKRPIAVVSMIGVGIGMIGAATAHGPFAASFLLLANFCTNACSRVVPWVLIGEVFTNEMRAVASGLSSCICYVMAFILSYTYLQVEAALTLRVLLGFYGGVGIIGAVAYYAFLPETEGKSLAEVQRHFDRKNFNGVDNPAFDKEKQ